MIQQLEDLCTDPSNLICITMASSHAPTLLTVLACWQCGAYLQIDNNNYINSASSYMTGSWRGSPQLQPPTLTQAYWR